MTLCFVAADRGRTMVVVLYPEHGVTKLQKLQLHDVQSENVSMAGKISHDF